jgi:uncharacterized protein (DUF2336 family)
MLTSRFEAPTPIGVMDHPSWVRRAMLIEQAATRYRVGEFSPQQQHAAEDAFRVVLYDGEPLVRCVLADSLKRLTDIPRDIIGKLAQDEAQVARPVLQHSPVLSDDELVRIVQNFGRSHRLAIAERGCVSPRVADALCATRDPVVLRRLLANDGASLPEEMLHAVLTTFGTMPGVVETIARRRLLPVSVMERLHDYDMPDNVSRERLRLAG